MEQTQLMVPTGFSKDGKHAAVGVLHWSALAVRTLSSSHNWHRSCLIPRTDGVPSLGWENTIAFLILPVFLVVSQFASMQLMQPKSDDPAQQQSNAILKFLPLMIGWFSLNVPAALCLYWVINNIVTTASTVIVRNSITTEPVKTVASGSSAAAASPMFAPPRERPAGFGDAAPRRTAGDDVKPITAVDDVKPIKSATVTDAEIVNEVKSDAADGEADMSDNKKRGSKKKRKKSN